MPVDYPFNPLPPGQDALVVSDSGDDAQHSIEIEHNRNLDMLKLSDGERAEFVITDIEAE